MPTINQSGSSERNEARFRELQEEQAVHSENFGGLNTIASQLNIPYEDSPNLLNVLVDISGNVRKRPGTRIIYQGFNATFQGDYITNMVTPLKYNYLVAKVGTSLLVFEAFNDQLNLLMTKTNVFSNAVNNVTPSVAATSTELEPRLIFCTGYNRPVQLRFTTQQFIQTSAGTTAAIPDTAARFTNASAANTVVYINRQRWTSATFSYASNTLTLSGLPTTAVGDTIDVCLITWQWWTEAQTWTGDAFFKTTNRFNVNAGSDLNVQTPSTLVTDYSNTELTNSSFNMQVYSNTVRSSNSYTFASNKQPSTATQWCFSDGAVYVVGASNYLTPSPYFITFGALQAGGNSSPIYFSRRRLTKFNNYTPCPANEIDVYVDYTKRTQITSAGSAADNTYGNYWLLNYATGGGATVTTTTGLADGLFFDGSVIGLSATSRVQVAHNKPNHIGSAALSTLFNYDDGSYYMAYGLGNYCDYLNGYYPSTVALYQGRLVFAGFPHKPLAVLFSALNDTVIPTQYFNAFGIVSGDTSVTSPFDVVISSRADDYIVALVEWHCDVWCILPRR